MAQEISHVGAVTAAGLVGIISIANGSGRFLWAWFSDAIGRKAVFLTMFLVQAAGFLLLSHVSGFASLTTLAFVILLCYGGGFGTMPAFAGGLFRSEGRRIDLRTHADGLGRGGSGRPDLDRAEYVKQPGIIKVLSGSWQLLLY